MADTFDDSFQKQLATQSWSLYGAGMFMIGLRTFARWRRARGFNGLAPDDWIMMSLVPLLYTTLIVCLNLIAGGGGSNLYPPGQFDTFTPEDIKERILGSKIVVVSEQAMLNLIWSLKTCMLFMYARMTAGTRHRTWVIYLGGYVAIGWVAVETAFFTACRPFKGYWGMPPPDPQCTTLQYYAIVNACFNISSDLCMLLIPIPMVVSLKLPLKQKIVLGVVFSMGVFVIIAAILTKVYNLSDVYSTVYMLWYVRESSVAIYVSNLPGIWPLLREHIRFLRNHTSYPASSGMAPYGNISGSRQLQRSMPTGNMSTQKPEPDEIELTRRSISKSRSTSIVKSLRSSNHAVPVAGLDDNSRSHHFGRSLALGKSRRDSEESDERVLNKDEEMEIGTWGKGSNLEVHVDRTIEVHRLSYDDRQGTLISSAGNVGRERAGWEIDCRAPKVRIEGPDGVIRA